MACFCCRRINTTTSLVVLFHLPRAERFVRHALLAEPAFLDLRRGCSFYPSLGNSEEMANSTFPCPIGIDSPLCLLSQHTWRRICSQLNTLSSAGEEEVPVPCPFVCGPLRTRGLEVTTMRRQITESMPSPQNLQDTDHEPQMRLRNSELMPSICQKG